MKLKNFSLIIAATSALTLLTACGDSKKDNAKEETVVEQEMKQKWPRPCEDDRTMQDTTVLCGSTYVVTIERKADETLPTVKDNLDHEFYDNRVNVRVTRDGSEFFTHSFTKEAFADYLGEAALKGSVLCGMAFDDTKTGGAHLCIAAQLGAPGEPEHSFTVDIPTSGGAFSILRDTSQDNNGAPEGEE